MSDGKEKMLDHVEKCAEEVKKVLRKHQCYLTWTDGIIFVEQQLGESVRGVGLEDVSL
jgi:hypothetical protein